MSKPTQKKKHLYIALFDDGILGVIGGNPSKIQETANVEFPLWEDPKQEQGVKNEGLLKWL